MTSTTLLAVIAIAALVGCSTGVSSGVDQCMRREIMMQCLATVKNGASSTHKDLGPLVEKCESAAYYQSLRRLEIIKDECRL